MIQEQLNPDNSSIIFVRHLNNDKQEKQKQIRFIVQNYPNFHMNLVQYKQIFQQNKQTTIQAADILLPTNIAKQILIKNEIIYHDKKIEIQRSYSDYHLFIKNTNKIQLDDMKEYFGKFGQVIDYTFKSGTDQNHYYIKFAQKDVKNAIKKCFLENNHKVKNIPISVLRNAVKKLLINLKICIQIKNESIPNKEQLEQKLNEILQQQGQIMQRIEIIKKFQTHVEYLKTNYSEKEQHKLFQKLKESLKNKISQFDSTLNFEIINENKTNKFFLTNLLPSITKNQIFDAFKQYGNITSLDQCGLNKITHSNWILGFEKQSEVKDVFIRARLNKNVMKLFNSRKPNINIYLDQKQRSQFRKLTKKDPKFKKQTSQIHVNNLNNYPINNINNYNNNNNLNSKIPMGFINSSGNNNLHGNPNFNSILYPYGYQGNPSLNSMGQNLLNKNPVQISPQFGGPNREKINSQNANNSTQQELSKK